MNSIVFDTVFFASVFCLVINVFLFSTLKNKSKTDKIISWYLLITMFETLFCYCIYHLLPDSNYFVSHLYFFIHFTFLSYFYYQIIGNTKIKKIIKSIYPIVYLFIIISIILNPKLFFGFNLVEIVSICFLLCVYAFIAVFQTLDSDKKYFYFSIGIILYFAISCLIFISGSLEKIMIFSTDPYIDHWIIKDLFFIIFQLFIFKEYLFLKKKQNELPE